MESMQLQKGRNQSIFNQNRETGKSEARAPLISRSLVMGALIKKAKMIAHLPSPVLILGRAGSGRNAVAYEIFRNTPQDLSLKTFSCCGLSAAAMEMGMFGSNYEKGEGFLLNNIRGRVLFIEGADLLPFDLQSRLLRFLQSRFYRDSEFLHGTRIICSADDNLPQKIKEGLFREDLFNCLSHNLLIVPSLPERREDIPELAARFLRESGFKGSLSQEAIKSLQRRSWKRNIKELQELCLKIALLYKNKKVVKAEDLPLSPSEDLDISFFIKYNPKIKLNQLINFYISMSLRHFQSKKKSADSLGVSIKTIYNKIQSGLVVDFSE